MHGCSCSPCCLLIWGLDEELWVPLYINTDCGSGVGRCHSNPSPRLVQYKSDTCIYLKNQISRFCLQHTRSWCLVLHLMIWYLDLLVHLLICVCSSMYNVYVHACKHTPLTTLPMRTSRKRPANVLNHIAVLVSRSPRMTNLGKGLASTITSCFSSPIEEVVRRWAHATLLHGMFHR